MDVEDSTLHVSEQAYAVKTMNKSLICLKNQVDNVFEELDILKRLPHRPTLVNLHYASQNERELFFIMDLAAGGSGACFFCVE